MPVTFRGGIYPEDNKEKTFASPTVEMAAPEFVVIPMSQHIGPECHPTVSQGDRVLMGQLIGDSDEEGGCPVHSSVSGTVKSVSMEWHPSGVRRKSVVIKNDFEDRWDASCVPYAGIKEALTPEQIIDFAREGGIVGMGGYAFPLYSKLRDAYGKGTEILIVNGVECEPFLTADHRAMVEYPNTILNGIKLVMQCLSPREVYFAIGDDKPDALATMGVLCEKTKIKVIGVHSKYPQGGEKQLIEVITGREVQPGMQPLDIGCIVLNVDTCASLARKIDKGRPLIKRIVTVTGSAVINPKNLLVRIGTRYRDVFEHCGGFIDVPEKIVAGGPMRGLAQHNISAPVIKDTSALIAFRGGSDPYTHEFSCIRCGKCIEVCPMRLMPNYLYAYSKAGRYDKCTKYNVADCIECGSCSYVCPGKLYLVQAIRKAKAYIKK